MPDAGLAVVANSREKTLWEFKEAGDIVQVLPSPLPGVSLDRMSLDPSFLVDHDAGFRIDLGGAWLVAQWFSIAEWLPTSGFSSLRVQYHTFRGRNLNRERGAPESSMDYFYGVLHGARVAYRFHEGDEWEVSFPSRVEYLGSAGKYVPDPSIGGTSFEADRFLVASALCLDVCEPGRERIQVSFISPEKPRVISLSDIKVIGITSDAGM